MRQVLSLCFCWVILVAPLSRAEAQSVVDEVSGGATNATPENPRAWYVSERLGFAMDVGETFSFHVDGTYTRDQAAPPQQASFPGSGGNVLLFAAGAEWDPNDHWALGLDASLSPPSTTFTSTSVRFTGTDGAARPADAELMARTSSAGASLFVEYDTANDGDFETVVGLYAGALGYRTTQRIRAIEDPVEGTITAQQLREYCASHRCSKALRSTLKANTGELGQMSLGLGVTETLYRTTDIGLLATYYGYTTDPTEVGYFSVAAFGRGSALGEGIPIAPRRLSIKPSVAHRFGAFRLSGWVAYARFVDGEGYDLTAGLKGQYKLSSRWKAWMSTWLQHDVTASSAPINTLAALLGARVSF